MKKLILLILLANHFSGAYNQIIRGTIIDKDTKEKVVGAAVYLSGTFVGTYSDQNGNFQLDVSKNNSIPLSIRALGYNSFSTNDYLTTDSLLIYLIPKVFGLNEVVVGGKSLQREKRLNVRLFKDIFLGTTSNARSCKIINENDITFNYKSDKDTLRAFASKPLKIENRSLGYWFTYYLDKFEYNRKDKTFFFLGNIVFDQDMTTKETEESYERKRRNSYNGSKMHFFRTLWADNLKNSGFILENASGENLDYRNIVIEDKDHKKYLFYNGSITILYNSRDVKSKIVFRKERVPFDSTGYYNGSLIKWEGQMVNQRIGDFLPYEYGLKKMPLLKKLAAKPTGSDTKSNQDPAEHSNFPRLIEKVYLHTDRTYYYPGDDLWFKVYLINAFGRSLSNHTRNLHVELISPSKDIISSRIIKLDSGLGNGDFKLPVSLSSGRYRLRAYTNYMRNFSDKIFFNKEIDILKPSAVIEKPTETGKTEQGSIYLSFFPEGGSLVDNVSSLVAFKAVDDQGKGCDVSGTVYSSSGEMVTMFRSSHMGMGQFAFKPLPGLSYYAVVKGDDDKEIRSEISKSFASGVSLSASIINDNVLSVIVRTNEQTLPLIRDRDLVLAVSIRKEIVQTTIFRIDSLSNTLILTTDDLPDGIIMLTLTSPGNLPLAERLLFLQRDQTAKVNIQTDKTVYKSHDSVSVKISLSGDSDGLEKAFLSFSATGSDFTDNITEFPTNIASWFLLESDVRGIVEGPSYYFDPSNPDRFKDLDLLLRTQGWRDFAWKSDTANYFKPEAGFLVSGRLRRLNRDKPLIDSKIHLTIFQGNNILSETVPVDQSGRYWLDNIDITGDARLIASAVDRKGTPNGLLLLDSIKYEPAEISDYSAASEVVKKEETQTSTRDEEIKRKETVLAKDYQIKEIIRKNYSVSDTIPIGEVIITAQKPKDIQVARIESVRRVYGGKPDNEVIVTPAMENLRAAPELLIGLPGIFVTQSASISRPSEYTIRLFRAMPFSGLSDNRPLILIDGIKMDKTLGIDQKAFDLFPISVIDRIDILKSAGKTSVYGLEGANGVISIITRSGPRLNKENSPVKHTVSITFSGYETPRVFYSPHHDPAQQSYNPDIRTTLFWKPDITLQEGKGFLLDYFNADNPSTIRIIVEGITSTGIPVTATTQYQVVK